MSKLRFQFLLFALLSIAALLALPVVVKEGVPKVLAVAKKVKKKLKRKKYLTVKGAIAKYGKDARVRLGVHFKKAGLSYPPQKLILIGLKDEESMLIYAREKENSPAVKVVESPILGTSGTTGPKLEEGDYQMPEGFYRISAFNPNSMFHLSLRVNYPNKEDRTHGAAEGRKKLGGDIMIHGSNVSIGCLAMGDDAIEEIFTLVYDTGRDSTEVILAPCDLTKRRPVIDMKKQPKWLPSLYARLKTSLSQYLAVKAKSES